MATDLSLVHMIGEVARISHVLSTIQMNISGR